MNAGFPATDMEKDWGHRVNAPYIAAGDDRDNRVDKLLEKVPQSIWQPNAVVREHRKKATLYWLLLLLGYGVYIGLVSGSAPLAKNIPHLISPRSKGRRLIQWFPSLRLRNDTPTREVPSPNLLQRPPYVDVPQCPTLALLRQPGAMLGRALR